MSKPVDSIHQSEPRTESEGESQTLSGFEIISDDVAHESVSLAATSSPEKPQWMQARQQQIKEAQSEEANTLEKKTPEEKIPEEKIPEKKLQKKRRRRALLFPMLPPKAEQDLEEEPWNFQRFLKKSIVTGFGLSLLFHCILLLTLSIWGWHSLSKGATFSTLAGFSETENTEVVEIPDTLFDSEEGATASIVSPLMPTPEVNQAAIDSKQSLEMMEQIEQSALENAGSGTGLAGFGLGKGFGPPAGTKVVTKGSFAAWTVPADPKPRQNYKIIILVKLPQRIKKYRTSDLSGIIVGTDRYRQVFPTSKQSRDRKKKYLPIKEHVAQLEILVPGAAALVRDTIRVESKILKERQQLEITF